MTSPSLRTGFESHSTIELDEFIRKTRNHTTPPLSWRESEHDRALREKGKRTQLSEFEAKEQSERNAKVLKEQQEALQGILSELARPWYKTANGWFSLIAMTAAIVGVALSFY